MRWRFAFNRRWFGYLGAAIVFAIACVFLSQWQFARADSASDQNERVEANYDSSPVPLSEARWSKAASTSCTSRLTVISEKSPWLSPLPRQSKRSAATPDVARRRASTGSGSG